MSDDVDEYINAGLCSHTGHITRINDDWAICGICGEGFVLD